MNKILVIAILMTVITTGCQKSGSNDSGSDANAAVSQTEASSRKSIDPQDSSSDDIVTGDSDSEVKK